MKRVVIIGGMAAGCKTAARLRRLDQNCEITIVEKLPIVSFGACGMPFYASGDVDSFEELMSTAWGTVRTPEFFKNSKNINILTETVCTKIVPEHNFVEIEDKSGKKKILDYDYLVIATGSKPIEPSFEFPKSERVSFFHSPLDSKKFRKLAEEGKISDAVIIGGGFIGCELADALTSMWGINVTLIEKENSLLFRYFDPEISNILYSLFQRNGISIMLNTLVDRIESFENKLTIFTDKGIVETDYVFLALGVKPNAELAQESGIAVGEKGGICVDAHLKTNFENVFAAGDCIETTNLVTGKKEIFALGSLANRQGRVVADNIAGLQSDFEGAVGAISLKVFDTVFASTGISSYCAARENITTDFALGTFYDRPHYYPESEVIFAKVLYDRKSGSLLGFQICGKGETTRYVDVFTQLLHQKSNYKALFDVEHSYTPPHSSPMNPLNYLGGIIENQMKFGIKAISPAMFGFEEGEWTILDLRTESEIKELEFDAASIHIDFDNLTNELNKINGLDKILCVCQKGPRAMETAIWLKQSGKKEVAYLAGGLQMLNSLF